MTKTQQQIAQHTLQTLRHDLNALLAAGLGATPLDLASLSSHLYDLVQALFSTIVHRRIGHSPGVEALCKQTGAAILTDNPDLVTCAKCRAAQAL